MSSSKRIRAVGALLLPLLWQLAAIGIGVVLAFILSRLLTPKRSTDNRLILVIAMLLGLSGLCAVFDISPLLSCMVFGAVYINMTNDGELYRQLTSFTPPVMSLFFIASGMKLDLNALSAFGIVGAAYFLRFLLDDQNNFSKVEAVNDNVWETAQFVSNKLPKTFEFSSSLLLYVSESAEGSVRTHLVKAEKGQMASAFAKCENLVANAVKRVNKAVLKVK